MTSLLESTTKPIATNTQPPGYQPRVTAGGEQFRTFVHPELYRETPILEIENFSLVWFHEALYHITLPIPKGKVTALIGPSGCGKSTLLRSVNRLNDLVDSVRIEGDMKLNQDSIYDTTVDVIELRKRMGMVFQKSNPFPMSIFENVIYPLRIDGERNRSVLKDVCEKSLRGAALWDEVKDRLHESALGLSEDSSSVCVSPAPSPPSRKCCSWMSPVPHWTRLQPEN